MNTILKIQDEIEEILKTAEKSEDENVSLLKIAQAPFKKLRGELGTVPKPAFERLPFPAPAPPGGDERLNLAPAAQILLASKWTSPSSGTPPNHRKERDCYR